VTARSGAHCHLLAKTIIGLIAQRETAIDETPRLPLEVGA
jgi:hypothetical protein